MSIIFEGRGSDSPYVETITRGHTTRADSVIRPAENSWHMVLVQHDGTSRLLIVGPWTKSGVVSYPAGAELLWIRFKLGVFMPHLPTRNVLDLETILPRVSTHSFWLHQSAWQLPDFENADTFVDKLARNDVLVCDPVVNAALEDQLPNMASRTVRHRFLRATGLTQSHIRQMKRAQRARALLEQGVSIPDTMFEAGYFDQPHLTRSLKHFIGYTPAQILRMRMPQ